MKTIFIAENNSDQVKVLCEWLEKEFSDVHLLIAKTFEVGRDIIANNHIDLSVLDIGLTDGDDELGLQLAEQIREKYPYNTIIFQSVKYDHKYQTEIHNRIGSAIYLIKQELTQEHFNHVIKRELGRFQVPLTSFIFLKDRSRSIAIPTHKILHVDKMNHAHESKFFIYDQETDTISEREFRISLVDIVKQPGAKGFLLRCHQSHIVNQQRMEYTTVESFVHKVKIQHVDDLIPVGRTFRDATLKALERNLRK